MLCKLAVRNIHRSIRDYTIYFVTILFGVAVFYAFNSIGSQQVMFDLESNASKDMLGMTQMFINMFSWIVAAALGFLMIYANQLLIRRRKHEFGIYLTLGMKPFSVSCIVLIETILVGLASLAIGLVIGILLSQLLSFVTASLFGVMITHYEFVFSLDAFISTLVNFAIIYAVVLIFNVVAINRYKLITLLSANEKNERIVMRNPVASLIAFIVSIGILAVAYQQLSENGLRDFDGQFYLATALMLIGTLILFWSLSGFVISIITHIRGLYLRGLVPFTTRQISSKANTSFVSLWAICVMLFFSITVFSTGMGLLNVFTSDLEEANPYDDTLHAAYYTDSYEMKTINDSVANVEEFEEKYPNVFADGEKYDWNMIEKFEAAVPEWNKFVKEATQTDQWLLPGTSYSALFEKAGLLDEAKEISENFAKYNLFAISKSDYIEVMQSQGKQPRAFNDNQILLSNNLDTTQSFATGIVKHNSSIEILGEAYELLPEIEDLQYQNNALTSNTLTFIVPDSVIDTLRNAGALPTSSDVNVNFWESNYTYDQDFARALAQAFPAADGATYTKNGTDVTDVTFQATPWPLTSSISKLDMIDQARGMRMLITYLAIYIGFIFLVCTAAILAIQQLTLTTDSLARYRLLSNLGCDRKMLFRSLLVQILIYFLAPLVVAICHAQYALSVLSGTLFNIMHTDMTMPLLMALLLTCGIYVVYFVITYFTSRGVASQAIRQN